ncbi:hypothetical protein V8C43DRAFT_18214 [Trichoderma afarasin]
MCCIAPEAIGLLVLQLVVMAQNTHLHKVLEYLISCIHVSCRLEAEARSDSLESLLPLICRSGKYLFPTPLLARVHPSAAGGLAALLLTKIPNTATLPVKTNTILDVITEPREEEQRLIEALLRQSILCFPTRSFWL